MNLTIESIDECLKDMGKRRLVPTEDVPEFLDTSSLRIITEKIPQGSMTRAGGEIKTFVESTGVIDILLDKRNELMKEEDRVLLAAAS